MDLKLYEKILSDDFIKDIRGKKNIASEIQRAKDNIKAILNGQDSVAKLENALKRNQLILETLSDDYITRKITNIISSKPPSNLSQRKVSAAITIHNVAEQLAQETTIARIKKLKDELRANKFKDMFDTEGLQQAKTTVVNALKQSIKNTAPTDPEAPKLTDAQKDALHDEARTSTTILLHESLSKLGADENTLKAANWDANKEEISSYAQFLNRINIPKLYKLVVLSNDDKTLLIEIQKRLSMLVKDSSFKLAEPPAGASEAEIKQVEIAHAAKSRFRAPVIELEETLTELLVPKPK